MRVFGEVGYMYVVSWHWKEQGRPLRVCGELTLNIGSGEEDLGGQETLTMLCCCELKQYHMNDEIEGETKEGISARL